MCVQAKSMSMTFCCACLSYYFIYFNLFTLFLFLFLCFFCCCNRCPRFWCTVPLLLRWSALLQQFVLQLLPLGLPNSSVAAMRISAGAPTTTDASGRSRAPSNPQRSRFRAHYRYQALPSQCQVALSTWRTPGVAPPPLQRSKERRTL